MSYFKMTPNVAFQSRDELKVAHLYLCSGLSDIQGVISTLESMQGFSGEIQQLRNIRQRGMAQDTSLIRLYETLGGITEQYEECERKNHAALDAAPQRSASAGSQPSRPILDQIRGTASLSGQGEDAGISVQAMPDINW